MEPIPKSGLYYPNKIARLALGALEEVMGKNGLIDHGNAVVNFPIILTHDSASGNNSRVVLAWSAKAGGFESYRVSRDTLPDVQNRASTWLSSLITQRASTSFTDTAAVTGRTYYYRVFVNWTDTLGIPMVGKSNEIVVRW